MLRALVLKAADVLSNKSVVNVPVTDVKTTCFVVMAAVVGVAAAVVVVVTAVVVVVTSVVAENESKH